MCYDKVLAALLLGACAQLAAAAGAEVGIEQLLSKKGLSCDVQNSYLMKLSMDATDEMDTFRYRMDVGQQKLYVGDLAYLGVQSAQVLQTANGKQLALSVNAERFGLRVIKVAVNIHQKPYESFGYYWVAQGSPAQNRAALNRLLLPSGLVSQTPQGNTRVDCVIAG